MRFERIGRYDVTALIGEGGMGQVWQATDTQLNRQVALKILPDGFADDPDRLARFQREAHVLASLSHPGIAQIHGIEEAEGQRKAVTGNSVRWPSATPAGPRRPWMGSARRARSERGRDRVGEAERQYWEALILIPAIVALAMDSREGQGGIQ